MQMRRMVGGKQLGPPTVGVRTFRVKVDVSAVARNLAREEKRAINESDVLKLLEDAGFKREGANWIVRESDLGLLQPAEVLSIEPVEAKGDQRSS